MNERYNRETHTIVNMLKRLVLKRDVYIALGTVRGNDVPLGVFSSTGTSKPRTLGFFFCGFSVTSCIFFLSLNPSESEGPIVYCCHDESDYRK